MFSTRTFLHWISLTLKSLYFTFCSWFCQQLQNYIVVGGLLGYPRVLHQLLLDGNTYVIFSQQFLELLESLQCKGIDGNVLSRRVWFSTIRRVLFEPARGLFIERRSYRFEVSFGREMSVLKNK